MAILEIRTYGDPVLKQVAEPIKRITPRHRQLAKDMAETMYKESGLGLAANQIGLLERIIIVDVEWARNKEEENGNARKHPIAMINPEILEESVEDEEFEEGCLSIPGVHGDIWRPIKIKVRYQTLDGKVITKDCEGLFARCIQHEVDHLDGILFPDRMSKIKRALLTRTLNQMLKDRNKPAPETSA